MRHLILLGLLAGPVLACQDAAAPRDAGATLSEASDRAHLDLRQERTALIAAGDALSEAIAAQGVAAGLTAALADDALLLSPRVNLIEGRAAAATFLAGDPLAPSTLAWHIIAADVSSDGTQGYTWAAGTSTFDFGGGPTQGASFFLTYWRRTSGTPWVVAAMVLSTGGPHEGFPAGFGTPTNKHRRNFPDTEPAQQRAQVLSVDAAFSAASVSEGSGPAFARFAAPNAIAVSGGTFVLGPADIGVAFSSDPGDVVRWVPQFSDVAASGDLGFTVGEAVFELVQFGTFYSKYLSVWQKQNTGEWLYVADFGNSRPAPSP